MPHAIFSHANGYPSGAYAPLFDALEKRGLSDITPFDHRPLWADSPAPTFLSWRTYAQDLIDSLEGAEHPVWLVGHSMGGAAGVLAHQRRPDLFAGLVLIDPVLPPTAVWLMARVMNFFRPNGTAIVQRALKRPHHFETFEAAFTFYRGKRVFSDFSDEALRAYVMAAHSKDGEGVKLRYSGAWEACVYRSVPSVAGALRAVDKPCLVIAGEESYVLTPRTVKWIQRCNQRIDIQSAAGGHLLPLEAPDLCAEMIASYVETNS